MTGPSVPDGPGMDALASLRRDVEGRLETVFAGIAAQIGRADARIMPLVGPLRALTMRGGKRIRPAFVVAAIESVMDPLACPVRVVDLCAAVELFHSYLLIHDDWMDGDELRRGAPTVHAALGQALDDAHRGASVAILAGDLASALAQELICGSTGDGDRFRAMMQTYVAMQRAVVIGQTMDVLGSQRLDIMHDLKTGHYTIRGPLALGHAAAQGTPAAWDALEAYARPLGIAYQLRDDLMGVFGETAITGKAATSDVMSGKRTAPIQLAMTRLDPAGRAELTSLLESADPSALARVCTLLRSVDAEAAVNARIDALCAQAVQRLETANIRSQGRQLLVGLADLIGQRHH